MWRVSVFSLQGTVWQEVLELTDDTILLDPFAGRLKWALGYNVGYHNRKPQVNLHIYLKKQSSLLKRWLIIFASFSVGLKFERRMIVITVTVRVAAWAQFVL